MRLSSSFIDAFCYFPPLYVVLSHKILYYFHTYCGHVALPYLILDILRQACDIIVSHHHPIAKPTQTNVTHLRKNFI